jgi:hypothetical protein
VAGEEPRNHMRMKPAVMKLPLLFIITMTAASGEQALAQEHCDSRHIAAY